MLGTVGHAFAVNPDRALRRLAAEEGWGVLTFQRPVRLLGLRRPSGRTVAFVAGAAAVVAVVVVWRAATRRR